MAKPLIKITVVVSATLILSSCLVFIWASSPSWPSVDKQALLTHQYPAATSTDNTYSLLTYNIGYLSGMTNNRAVIREENYQHENMLIVQKHLNQLQPDILAFQEIDYQADRSFNVNQQNEIAKLGYNYVAQAVNWDVNYVPFPYGLPAVHFGHIVSGQSVLSKYPIIEHRRVVLERVPATPYYQDAFYLDRLAQVVKIVVDQRKIVVINVHLESYDRATRGRQLQQVLKLYERYSTTYPTLLVGDFNSDPAYADPFINLVLDIPGIGTAAFSKPNYENTFNSKEPFERLDYIFYNRAFIHPLESRVAAEFGTASDHLPVFFRFKLKQL